MPVTMDDVLAVLRVYEPDYAAAAQLGPEAVPYLKQLAASDDSLLAAKAVSLAAVIPASESADVVALAARSPDPALRVAAAAAAARLRQPGAEPVLSMLEDDPDDTVRALVRKSRESGSS